MAVLPILSGKELIKVLEKLGYRVVRQRGSHVRLKCASKRVVTVPNHNVIGKALLRKILRDIEINTEDFLKLM